MSSFPSNATIYTFASTSFARIVDGDYFPPFFNPEPVTTKDPVLGGTTAYIDFGADVYPPLAFRAWCLTSVARDALVAASKTTGTLSNTKSQSATATLMKAVPLYGGDIAHFWVELTFEIRP